VCQNHRLYTSTTTENSITTVKNNERAWDMELFDKPLIRRVQGYRTVFQ